jgi:hypothetical protein
LFFVRTILFVLFFLGIISWNWINNPLDQEPLCLAIKLWKPFHSPHFNVQFQLEQSWISGKSSLLIKNIKINWILIGKDLN